MRLWKLLNIISDIFSIWSYASISFIGFFLFHLDLKQEHNYFVILCKIIFFCPLETHHFLYILSRCTRFFISLINKISFGFPLIALRVHIVNTPCYKPYHFEVWVRTYLFSFLLLLWPSDPAFFLNFPLFGDLSKVVLIVLE